MPSFNVQMLTNVLASALTATVASWLSYLAAWSHFSSTDNSALATIIAAGIAIAIGQVVTVFINRYNRLLNAVAGNGARVVVTDQRIADALPNNPNVLGPQEARIVKQ